MSRAARFAVRLAARALPAGIRERHREEWLADLEGAREAGVRASGIAIGALLFSVTVQRDSPDVLGMPLSVAARRHARWATALLLSAGVLAFGTYITGGFGALTVVITLWATLAIVAALLGLVFAWRAAAIASPLAKIAAAILTIGVVFIVAAASVPNELWLAGVAGVMVLLVGATVGGIAWANSPHEIGAVDTAVAETSTTARRMHPALVAAIVMAAVLLTGLFFVFSGVVYWLAVLVLPLAAAAVGVRFVLRARRTSREPATASAWIAIVSTGLLCLATVAIGAADLLVWSPLAQAPSYTLEQIWATLSPTDAATGIGFALAWIVIWGVAGLLYLAGTISLLGRKARPLTRTLVSVGLLIVGATVFFQFWAGISLGMSIADTLPPYSGAGSEMRVVYAMAGQAALVGALLLGLTPRPLPATVAPRYT